MANSHHSNADVRVGDVDTQAAGGVPTRTLVYLSGTADNDELKITDGSVCIRLSLSVEQIANLKQAATQLSTGIVTGPVVFELNGGGAKDADVWITTGVSTNSSYYQQKVVEAQIVLSGGPRRPLSGAGDDFEGVSAQVRLRHDAERLD